MFEKYPAIIAAIFCAIGIFFAEIFQAIFSAIYLFSLIVATLVVYALIRKIYHKTEKFIFVALISFFAGFTLKSYENAKYFESLPPHNEIINARIYAKILSLQRLDERKIKFIASIDSLKSESINFLKNFKCSIIIKDQDKAELKNFYERLRNGYEIWASGNFFQAEERTNPTEFDYKSYLRQKNIAGIFQVNSLQDIVVTNTKIDLFELAVFETRKEIESRIKILFDSQTASLMKGFLLGDRSEIDEDSVEDFVKTGIVHILAVSGLHVGYVYLLISLIFGRLNLFVKSFLVISILFFYVFISGQAASITRAVIMTSITIIARLLNRDTNLFNSLALTALIIFIFDPNQLFNSGFQLSFAAVCSIGIFFPSINEKLKSSKIKNPFLKNILLFIGLTISAQAGVLPFVLRYFETFSLISILTNIVAVPLSGIALAAGIATLIFSVVSFWFAKICALTVAFFSKFLFWFAKISASIPYGFFKVYNFSAYDAFVYVFALAIFFTIVRKFVNFKAKAAFAFLIIINLFLFFSFDDEVFQKKKNYIALLNARSDDIAIVKNSENKFAMIGNISAINLESVVWNFIKKNDGQKISVAIFTDINEKIKEAVKYLIIKNLVETIFLPSLVSKEDLVDSRLNSICIKNNNIENKIMFYSKSEIDFGKDIKIKTLIKEASNDQKIYRVAVKFKDKILIDYYRLDIEEKYAKKLIAQERFLSNRRIAFLCLNQKRIKNLIILKNLKNELSYITFDNKIEIVKNKNATIRNLYQDIGLKKSKIYVVEENILIEINWK